MSVGRPAISSAEHAHSWPAGLPETLDAPGRVGRGSYVSPGCLALPGGRRAPTSSSCHRGRVAIEIHAPDRGARSSSRRSGPGHVVGLARGPPHRSGSSSTPRRARRVDAVAIDASGAASGLAANPAVGFRAPPAPLTGVLLERLQATRIRLLDLYANAGHDAGGRAAGPAQPAHPSSVPGGGAARWTRRRRHTVRRPGVSRGGEPFRFPTDSSTCCTAFGGGRWPISISSAPAEVGPIEHTVRDVGAVTRALCAAPVRIDDRRARPLRARLGA